MAIGLLALRIGIGFIFMKHGWDKWNNIDGTTAFFDGLGIPLAHFSAYLVATVELVGGLLVLLGIYTKEIAKFLAITMVVALLTAHIHGPWKGAELAFLLLGGSLALIGLGAGPWRLVKKECCYDGKVKK